jgi:hypothetical protein
MVDPTSWSTPPPVAVKGRFALVVDILATRHKPAGLDWGAADPFGALDAGWRPLLLSPGRRVLRVFMRL